MAIEQFIPAKVGDEDESLASFVRRRLGGEVLAKIAAPLMAGIHSADPETLSIRNAFPQFPEMERKHGSLSRAMLARKKSKPTARPAGPPPPMFLTLRGGVQQLIDGLVAKLDPKALRLNTLPVSVSRVGNRYSIRFASGDCMIADDIVFATPAYITADLVQRLDPDLAGSLRSIRHVSTATVSLGFKRIAVGERLQGFGFVVAHGEGRQVNAGSWSSNKFAGRAPEDAVLVRVFVGGALAEGLAEQDDAALIELARRELKTIAGIAAEPVLAKVFRWRKANPQQELGHGETIQTIENLLEGHPGLHLAGAGYRGSGIPDCLQSAMRAAHKIAANRDKAEQSAADGKMALCR
jgi:oxygen-dependent protoporphyrinogen oxidase